MKYFTLTTFALLILISFGSAQQPDSSKAKKRNRQKKEFVDRNGNGIDDRKEIKRLKMQKRMPRRKDRFIDRDGDGIADHREGDIMDRKRRGRKKMRRRR